jgi:protein-S-isoprenylcysteine O-methyltransferase Ste14
MYDALMRFPLLGWALFVTTTQLVVFRHYLSGFPIDFAHVAMRLSTAAFMFLMAAVVILRSQPSKQARGLEPRISALVGTFTSYGFVAFPGHGLTLPLELFSTVLTLIGTLGAIVVLKQLGRSFSIMAETRRLVTSGPYRFVRHPLYLMEEIAIVGVFMQFASVWTALMLAVQLAFQLRRMHNEEAVLTASFPEYTVYSQTTARLIPGIY